MTEPAKEVGPWQLDSTGTFTYFDGRPANIDYIRPGTGRTVGFDGSDLCVEEYLGGYEGYSSTTYISLELLRELLAFHGYRITDAPEQKPCSETG